MCEMAILDPQANSDFQLMSAAMGLHTAMGDGLGVVLVREGDERYHYDVYKAVDPEASDVRDFFEDNVTPKTKRAILHGRLATCGENSLQNTHPLKVECDHCDADFVAHNGVVYGHREAKELYQGQGHTFETEVDSEVIPHGLNGVPEFGEVYETTFDNEPAFVIGGETEVFVYTNGRYDLTEDMRMCLGYRDFGPDYMDENTQYREAKMIHPSTTEDN